MIDHYRTHKETVHLDQVLQLADEGQMPDEEVQTSLDVDVIRHQLLKASGISLPTQNDSPNLEPPESKEK